MPISCLGPSIGPENIHHTAILVNLHCMEESGVTGLHLLEVIKEALCVSSFPKNILPKKCHLIRAHHSDLLRGTKQTSCTKIPNLATSAKIMIVSLLKLGDNPVT
uniref:Uncharacterized protein n=1 Tax=Arundo donax TaxID=35708 RepID=A0A0A9EHY0_ARUDO